MGSICSSFQFQLRLQVCTTLQHFNAEQEKQRQLKVKKERQILHKNPTGARKSIIVDTLITSRLKTLLSINIPSRESENKRLNLINCCAIFLRFIKTESRET